VVNAVSTRLVAEVDADDGKRHVMEFRDGGKPTGKIKVVGDAPKGRTGTTIAFWPDPEIFKAEGIEFRAQTVLERLQTYAFLNKDLEIRFKDERPGHTQSVTYRYAGGITDYVRHLNQTKEALFKKVASYEYKGEDHEVEIALQWNTGYHEGIHSFANGIETPEGGTHEEGFRKALTNVVNKYAKARGLLKEKDENLLGEDIREGLTAIIAVKLQDPQFEGQTKGKLGTIAMRSAVEKVTNDKLAEWLEEHPSEAKALVTKATQAARARVAARAARDTIRRKSALEGAGLPGKLTDCRTKNAEEAELFIVEGDSAGGSAVRGRDPENQAILPLRGKPLNVERARIDKMLKNTEIQTLVTAVGAGIGEEFDADKARYGKVIILADADVDGSHIRALLLTFFFRQMRPLIEKGKVFVAQPPLYSTTVGKETVYLKDDVARERFLTERPNHKAEFARLKGLGEMDWEELRDTTMMATRRTLLRVSAEEAAAADQACSVLFGDDVESRKNFIVTNANDVRFLDI
ncbi:MAG TPA: toprim domain-containing protein, partial [Acidimicrobiales bacterium]|nr:toprim domain-containing protein [Acidimicrobiales bacterium]